MAQTEVLLRGPEELAREKKIVEETVEDIGRTVGEEIDTRRVEASQFEDEELRQIYRELEGPREFESEFERDEGGLEGRDMTSVLILQPYTDELRDNPVMYLTDRPLLAEDRETGETRHVYGVTQGSYHRPSTVMSTFAFQNMDEELHDELLETLAYHEGGHLLNEEGDREYRDEDEFGGGHCPNDDVMTGEGIWEDTENRYKNELYCGACTEEIRNGIKGL